ncbi:MAG: DUF4234 domain-containing protein [Oscillospiraceae bacterium]|nr:DUF4234 domain-containing protein [Oscillospiraceae bacterium]
MYIGKTRSPALVIVFTIITCGIYGIYWYYIIMDDLNNASGKEIINPVMFLILSII